MDHQNRRAGALEAAGAERQRARRSTTDQHNQQMDAPTSGRKGTSFVDASANEIDLVEMAYCLLARWKLIISLAMVLAIGAGVYTVGFVTPLYKATSTIYVLNPSDSVVNLSSVNLGNALAQDYIKVFKLWEVHDKVKKKLDLPYSYGQMKGMLSVKNDSNTRMLDITVTSSSAQEAANMANAYADAASEYIQEKMHMDEPSRMSKALVPSNPVSPSLSRNVILGFMMGAMLAAGFVVVRFLMDDRLRTAEDIRRYLNLTTLAVVPLQNADTVRKKSRRKHEKH